MLLILIILLFSMFFNLYAGDIEGKVYLPATESRTTKSPARYLHQEITHTTNPVAFVVKAVVFVADSFPQQTFVPPEENPVMDQRNEQFHPYILPVLVGTTVRFPNNDRVYHNVFSFSKAKTFDLGKYPTKTSKSVLFDKTGIVSVYCEIHSHMNAFVLVLPNAYFTTVQEDGRFIIRDVPSGNYTLKAFAGRDLTISKKISVQDSGKIFVELQY